MHKVKVGQIYKDNDPRTKGTRTLQVTKVTLETMPKSKKGNYGCAAEFADCDVYRDGVKTGTTRIHTKRMMKPTTSGYSLLDVHRMPRLEFEKKAAAIVMDTATDLLEASAADISMYMNQLDRVVKMYRDTCAR